MHQIATFRSLFNIQMYLEQLGNDSGFVSLFGGGVSGGGVGGGRLIGMDGNISNYWAYLSNATYMKHLAEGDSMMGWLKSKYGNYWVRKIIY